MTTPNAAPPPDAQLERDTIALRQGTSDDADIIYSSWLRSYRHEADDVSHAVYYAGQQGVIDALLKRGTVLVACDPDDAANVFGWACFEVRAGILVLHYVYVKKHFRRLGLGRLLLRELQAHPDVSKGLAYTHRTPAAKHLLKKQGVYNPYLTR